VADSSGVASLEEVVGFRASSSIPNSFEAGGPTGTILEPNSTPMVTS